MEDLILLKNGGFKKIKNKKKFKHKEKVKHVLLYMNSAILGEYYYTLPFNAYAKLRDIESITLKYGFVKGVVTDDEGSTEDDLKVGYEYKYSDVNELFNKITEIITAEDVLNEVYWCGGCSAFYNNYFTDLKVKVKYKNKRKSKKMGLDDFYKMLNLGSYIISEKIIKLKFNKDEWKESYKIGDNSYFRAYGNIFFNPQIDNLSKVKKIKYKMKADGIPMNYYFDGDNERDEIAYKEDVIDNNFMLHKIFNLPMYEVVICDIEEEDFKDIKVKANITCYHKNGDKVKYKR